ncbi:TPA: CDC48 family AAA ATPase, partial [archaeon]|nr:CDC48 family AAA ATPase [Candidatus Naiadarchaeales archaeon SRR2090153.bin1042]
IGGLSDAISKVREMIELPLKHPELFEKLGVEPPKGVLLYGPPGTGKTLLAKAVANETNANFIAINGPEIMSKWYGESEKQLREVFEEAEKSAPSIIFIDEIDAIAPKREEVTGAVERRVVATLLSQMDGLKTRGKVVVIAASNRPEALDPALRRGGRFDREIEIGVPDRKGRKEVLQIHTRAMPLEPDVDLDEWADVTYGFVGADLEALCKEAAMATLRRILPKINIEEEGEIPRELLEELKVLKKDFKDAFKNVSPSAMREVLVEVPKVKWNDIGGLDELKQQLKEAVEWPLKNPKMFKKMGIKPPKGILLYGPPGTGKTLLAKAVANESDANFISVKGPEIFSKWVGESERAIRKIFGKAKQVAPCIVFFDELDAIAPIRGRDSGTHVTETVVNQLLTELDGLEELEGVVIIGASNRPDIIDPGLLRPGRFDRLLFTPVPEKESRLKIFKVHTKNMPLAKDVSIEKLAAETEEYVGADIEAICREAAMIALRKSGMKAEEVSMAEFKAAMDVVRPTMNEEMKTYYENVFKEFKRKAIAVPVERPKYLG